MLRAFEAGASPQAIAAVIGLHFKRVYQIVGEQRAHKQTATAVGTEER